MSSGVGCRVRNNAQSLHITVGFSPVKEMVHKHIQYRPCVLIHTWVGPTFHRSCSLSLDYKSRCPRIVVLLTAHWSWEVLSTDKTALCMPRESSQVTVGGQLREHIRLTVPLYTCIDQIGPFLFLLLCKRRHNTGHLSC